MVRVFQPPQHSGLCRMQENAPARIQSEWFGFGAHKASPQYWKMGFMTNQSDDEKMQDPDMQKNMVQGIADGIDAYFSP